MHIVYIVHAHGIHRVCTWCMHYVCTCTSGISTSQVPLKYLSSTSQVPLKYLSSTSQVPLKNLSSTSQTPLKYLSSTSQIPLAVSGRHGEALAHAQPAARAHDAPERRIRLDQQRTLRAREQAPPARVGLRQANVTT